MAGPWMLPAAGAAIGAMTNKDDPLKGAVMGGIGGVAAGPILGGLAGTSAAYGATVPGVSMGSQQAAQLAAQTGEFGLAGLKATQAAAAPGLTGGLATNAFNPVFNNYKGLLLQGQGQESPMPQPSAIAPAPRQNMPSAPITPPVNPRRAAVTPTAQTFGASQPRLNPIGNLQPHIQPQLNNWQDYYDFIQSPPLNNPYIRNN